MNHGDRGTKLKVGGRGKTDGWTLDRDGRRGESRTRRDGQSVFACFSFAFHPFGSPLFSP